MKLQASLGHLKDSISGMPLQKQGETVKKMWKVVKQLFGTFKQKNRISEINGKTENMEIAEEINQFFADIGPNLAKEIPDSVLDMDFSFNGDYPKFQFVETDEIAIGKLLDNMSSNKSMGIDGIPIRFLKMCRNKSG